jgi:hypothetical protein
MFKYLFRPGENVADGFLDLRPVLRAVGLLRDQSHTRHAHHDEVVSLRLEIRCTIGRHERTQTSSVEIGAQNIRGRCRTQIHVVY